MGWTAQAALLVLSLPLSPCGLVLGLTALAGLGRLGWRWAGSRQGRRRLERWFLGLPVLGRALRSVETARICDSLALLSEAGLPLSQCIESARRVCTSVEAADAMDRLLSEVSPRGDHWSAA